MKEKAILELLIIVRENIDKYFSTGLCGLFRSLVRQGLLTYYEDMILTNYLKKHLPKHACGIGEHWWESGIKKPRITYLNKRIRIEKWKQWISKLF